MRTLSSTLLAAQKSPSSLPYVEAKVYDFEQGIKRLTWERLYTGTEPDNHHGIAFDGEGSMHRVASRHVCLLYHKTSSPAPGSDFSFKINMGVHCHGPCAIASYGARIYIFHLYGNPPRICKLYSEDYGATWHRSVVSQPPQTPNGLSACWKGTTSIVVCFAATDIQLRATVLETADQSASEYFYNHALDTTYGIGATFRDNQFPLIFGGKDTVDTIVTYSLYASQLTAAYGFLEPIVILSAQDDQSTIFKEPDCHSPATPYDYETLLLTVVESYSGTTAYNRPLFSHLVKGTDWSSATITEPKPFINISSTYGLRLMTDSSYWWLERPDGVWRAPRVADALLDLTPHILRVQQAIHANTPGYIKVELDNSRSQFATPPSKGSEVVLKLGYKTGAGNEVSDAGHYWIDGWEWIHDLGLSTFRLFCTDAWGLASAWAARYSLRWNYTAFSPCVVWVILYQLLGRAGIRLWNNPDVTKSNSMDNYQPKFLVRGGSHGHTELKRLLSFVTDGLIPREALTFIKDLLSTEASCYEYHSHPEQVSGSHPIIKGSYGENLTITHTQVSGETDEDPPTPVRESAFDWENLARGIDNLVMQYVPDIEETAQAQYRADALLRAEAQKSLGGQIIVPINCGQELYDVVTITDNRVGIVSKKYRILDIQADYDHRKAIYQQRLALGAP